MSYVVTLNDAYKQFTLDQDKVMAPEETVSRLKQRLERMDLNILAETVRIDRGRLNIPVFFSICGKDAKAVTGTVKQMGKGGTPEQAEASAVMELAERFSFFSFAQNPDHFFIDTYKSVSSEAVPFDLIAKSVHDSSDELDQAKKIFEELPLNWTWGYNLTREEPVLVPFDWFFAINEFNGPSAGNCVEEALSQGICEIIERHVCSIVSHSRLSTLAIRPESATDPLVREMLAKYEKVGVKLFINDLTLDTGVPTVGVFAYDPSTFPEKSELVWTAGTTPDPEKALSRALTEVAQLAGDFNTESNYVASGLPKFKRLEDAAYVMNADRQCNLSDLPDLSDNNIKTEVLNLISALKQRDMEVIVIDTMHGDLMVPAFYTIVPGAHFRERALGTSVGMFSAKLISESLPPAEVIYKLQEFEKILPGKYYSKFYQATALLDMGDPRTALDCLRKANEMDPNTQDRTSIYSYMGVCLKEMERYEEALAVLKKGEALDNERTDIYNLMGFCHFMMKNHEEAIACFKRNVELDPMSAIDYANIASNYRDMGNKKEAVKYYEWALSLDQTIDFAWDNLRRLKKSSPDD